MKQLLFLLLFPCLAMAQYTGNAGQKITLGEQTTADGLVFRGVASIDTVTATSKITRANKQDTSAFLLLDTTTNLLWHYKTASNGWIQAGGSTFDTTTLNLVSRFALKLNISDTASMLTPYWRSGRFSGVLPVANGGTGQSTLTANKVMVGNGTSGVISATNLTWDNVNSRLGIGVATPLSAIHTNGILTTGSTNVGYVNLKGFLWGTTGLEADYRWQSDVLSSDNLTFRPRYSINDIIFDINNGSVTIENLANASNPVNVQVDVNGKLVRTSSINIKEDVQNLPYGLNEIMLLQPSKFSYIDKYKYGEGYDIGFIAEDVINVIPEAVGTGVESDVFMDSVKLIPILTKAIQEQNALIKALEQRILILENK